MPTAAVKVSDAEKLKTAAAAGVSFVCADFEASSRKWPLAIQAEHFQFAITYGRHRNLDTLVSEAEAAMVSGAHSIYCVSHAPVIEHLAKRDIPVFCHTGLVPQICTGAGGLKAIGNTPLEAERIRKAVSRFENAGAVGVYLQVVPEPLAQELTENTGLVTVSLGAGRACDVTWAHGDDVLGLTNGHVPRHARVYAGSSAMNELACFQQLKADVSAGRYPAPPQIVDPLKAPFELK